MKTERAYGLINTAYPQFVTWKRTVWILKIGDLILTESGDIQEVVAVVKKPIEGHTPEIKTQTIYRAGGKMTIEIFNNMFKDWIVDVDKQKKQWILYRKLHKGEIVNKVQDVTYPVLKDNFEIVPDYLVMRVIKN